MPQHALENTGMVIWSKFPECIIFPPHHICFGLERKSGFVIQKLKNPFSIDPFATCWDQSHAVWRGFTKCTYCSSKNTEFLVQPERAREGGQVPATAVPGNTLCPHVFSMVSSWAGNHISSPGLTWIAALPGEVIKEKL